MVPDDRSAPEHDQDVGDGVPVRGIDMALLDALGVLASRCTANGDVLACNAAYAQHLARTTPDQLIGRRWPEVSAGTYGLDLASEERSLAVLRKELADPGAIFVSLFPFAGPDGIRWLQWTCGGVHDEDGTLQEIVAIGVDVTSSYGAAALGWDAGSPQAPTVLDVLARLRDEVLPLSSGVAGEVLHGLVSDIERRHSNEWSRARGDDDQMPMHGTRTTPGTVVADLAHPALPRSLPAEAPPAPPAADAGLHGVSSGMVREAGIFVAADGRALWAGAAAEEVFGDRAVVDDPARFSLRVHPGDRAALAQAWLTWSRPGRTTVFRYLHPLRGWRHIETTATHNRVAGNEGGVLHTTRDISELVHLHQHMTAVLSVTADAVLAVRDGVVTWESPRAVDVLGESVVGRAFTEITARSDAEGCRILDRLGQSTRRPMGRFTVTYDHPARGLRWLRAAGSPAPHLPGTALVTIADVTRPETERRMGRILLAGSGEAVLVIEADESVSWANATCRRWFAGLPDEALGNVHPDDLPLARRLLDQIRSPFTTEVGGHLRLSTVDGWHQLGVRLVDRREEWGVTGIIAYVSVPAAASDGGRS